MAEIELDIEVMKVFIRVMKKLRLKKPEFLNIEEKGLLYCSLDLSLKGKDCAELLFKTKLILYLCCYFFTALAYANDGELTRKVVVLKGIETQTKAGLTHQLNNSSAQFQDPQEKEISDCSRNRSLGGEICADPLLKVLPVEIFETVLSSLHSSDLSRLGRSSKACRDQLPKYWYKKFLIESASDSASYILKILQAQSKVVSCVPITQGIWVAATGENPEPYQTADYCPESFKIFNLRIVEIDEGTYHLTSVKDAQVGACEAFYLDFRYGSNVAVAENFVSNINSLFSSAGYRFRVQRGTVAETGHLCVSLISI